MNKIESSDDFKKLSLEVAKVIGEKSGNVFGPQQFHIVEARIKQRILELGYKAPKQYHTFLKNNWVSETQHLLGLLTNHHTFFFREFSQFEYLKTALPKLIECAKAQGRNVLHFWSAACSRGQEVYTLAMFLEKHLKAIDSTMDYRIDGSDVDPKSVEIGRNGVYPKIDLYKAPLFYTEGQWQDGKRKYQQYTRISQHIKDKCHFFVHNLLEDNSSSTKYDGIFIRNVLIYFDSANVQAISKNLVKNLAPHGFVICGSSENLRSVDSELSLAQPCFYVRKNSTLADKDKSKAKTAIINTTKLKRRRVVCIDDSGVILKLLDQVFSAEYDFEVVGVAKNGLEAESIVEKEKPDLVTLDLNMPVMDGIQYLQKNYNDNHPPVLLISSTQREDLDRVNDCLRAGASDFVEKPNAKNVNMVSDEIRAKAIACLNQKQKKQKSSHPSLDNISPNTNTNKTRLLIVEDSSAMRMVLKKILAEDPQIEVVGEAETVEEGIRAIETTQPDVISLDINLKGRNGVEFLKEMNKGKKVPTILLTSLNINESEKVFEALSIGAVDYFQKPKKEEFAEFGKKLCEKIKIVKQAKLISSFGKKILSGKTQRFDSLNDADITPIFIGASTGGPVVFEEILSGLGPNIPPIVFVLHIPPVFSESFARRLDERFPFDVKEAKNGDVLKNNCVYVAPGGFQVSLERNESRELSLRVREGPAVNGFSPSVDHFFLNVTKSCSTGIGVICTGMGKDGARGMLALKERGFTTIAQNKESCAVFGMPRAAIELGAIDITCDASEISDNIVNAYNKIMNDRNIKAS